MTLRGKTVLLNTRRQGMWRDEVSGLNLSQFSEDNLQAIVPEDPSINIAAVEKAVSMGLLLVAPEKTKRGAKLGTPRPKKKVPTGTPAELIRMTAKHIAKRIIPYMALPELEAMLGLELNAKNYHRRTRKGVITAILAKMKKLGANETQIMSKISGDIIRRDYTEERGFKEPRDAELSEEIRDTLKDDKLMD